MFDLLIGTATKRRLSGNILPNINTCENWCQYFSENLRIESLKLLELRGQFRRKIISFYYTFYAIMHRTTIVQNKILSIICSWFFFGPANIYRPILGKVRLGRPNPIRIQPLNFYLRRKKKTILPRIVCTTTVWSPIFNFHLK